MITLSSTCQKQCHKVIISVICNSIIVMTTLVVPMLLQPCVDKLIGLIFGVMQYYQVGYAYDYSQSLYIQLCFFILGQRYDRAQLERYINGAFRFLKLMFPTSRLYIVTYVNDPIFTFLFVSLLIEYFLSLNFSCEYLQVIRRSQFLMQKL